MFFQLQSPSQVRILRNFLNSAETIIISNSDDVQIGVVHFNILRIFNMVDLMFNGSFMESGANLKTFKLHPWFSDDKAKIFVNILSCILDDSIELSDEELIVFVVAADMMDLDDGIFTEFLKNKLYDTKLIWKLYQQFIEIVAGLQTGSHLCRYIEMLQKNISNSVLHDIDRIPFEYFLFSVQKSRNFLMKLIRNCSKSFQNEMEFAIVLVNKLASIDNRLSLKALYDFTTIIDWFFVPNSTKEFIIQKFHTICTDFKVTSRISNDHRSKLIDESTGIFHFSEKITLPLIEDNPYICTVDQQMSKFHRVYTTTTNIRAFEFKIQTTEIKNGEKQKVIIVKLENVDTLISEDLHLVMSIYRKDGDIYSIFENRNQWQWTFFTKKMQNAYIH